MERQARKVRKGHYVATHNSSPSPPYGSTNRAYFSDGEDSRAPSERTLSEYTMANERSTPPQAPARKSRSKSREGVYDGPRPLSIFFRRTSSNVPFETQKYLLSDQQPEDWQKRTVIKADGRESRGHVSTEPILPQHSRRLLSDASHQPRTDSRHIGLRHRHPVC
jgi:hypothetical protein